MNVIRSFIATVLVVMIEHFLPMGSLVRVQSIKTVMVVMLVALWALASNHCRLELVSGLSFMACSQQNDCAGQQDKDCETDGCATVENQFYKAETTQQSMPAPVLLFAFFLNPLLDELAIPEGVSHVLPDAAPTELARVWQFSYRTALPPRAPSLLS